MTNRLTNTYTIAFAKSLIATALSMLIVSNYFNHSAQMACSALIAISLATLMDTLIEENRQQIWHLNISPIKANLKLAGELLSIFIGIFVMALILQLFMPKLFAFNTLIANTYFNNQLIELFRHNLAVLLGALVFGFIYRAGGLIVILAWNAIYWSTSFIVLAKNLAHTNELTVIILSSLAILPHFIWEIVAYAIAGMAGMFLSKAAFKYNLTSPEFYRVSRACVIMTTTSIAALTVATFFEIYLAQPAIQ